MVRITVAPPRTNLSHTVATLSIGRDLRRWTQERRWERLLRDVRSVRCELAPESDAQLARRSAELRTRHEGQRPLSIRELTWPLALGCEAMARRLGIEPYAEQLVGAMDVYRGAIIEMETGEGKTVTAALAAMANVYSAGSVHLVTANDYLAGRDAQWMAPVYHLLGMTVAWLQHGQPPERRRAAYQSDIVYGTAKEIGFDLLRDRLARRRHGSWRLEWFTQPNKDRSPVQRWAKAAIVDEADSVLIDDAEVPLVISDGAATLGDRETAQFTWAAEAAGQFVAGTHYRLQRPTLRLEWFSEGRSLLARLAIPTSLDGVPHGELVRCIERAIIARDAYRRDEHYFLRQDEIVLIDEFTGRPGEGRQWQGGIHQAIEAKEGVPITAPGVTRARITVQDLFLRYRRLGGMTGTAASSRAEFQRIYGRRVVAIPPHQTNQRRVLPPTCLPTEDAKWDAIVAETRTMVEQGRPVLIGTRSIEKSETLARRLAQAGIAHCVLNARHTAEEARVVAQAGHARRVTVATNMAGRGTDICLGPEVAQRGGLHVIGSELHASRRIDRQLAGRCARQGDPGTFHQFMSLDDPILDEAWGTESADRIRRRLRSRSPDEHQWIRLLEKAQRRVESRRFHARQRLLKTSRRRADRLEQQGHDPLLDFYRA